MDKFSLPDTSRRKLAGILDRAKPALTQPLIKRFISECEREVNDWLQWWPEGTASIRTDASKALRNVEKKANELLAAMRTLDDGTSFILYADQLGATHRGVTQNMTQRRRRLSENLLSDFSRNIQNCQDGFGAPIWDRRKDDLAHRIVRAYIKAFSRNPSVNMDGVFAQFLKELCDTEAVKEYGKLTIGRKCIETAIRKNCEYLPGGCYGPSVQ